MAWWEKVTQWRLKVEAVMQAIHSADPANWRTLGDVPMKKFVRDSPDLNHKLSMLSRRLWKLEVYINERTKFRGS